MDDSLSFESFYEGAKKVAHRAMEDHGRGEYDEFALHAGVAIERLAKAVLVSRNPIYIIEVRGNVSTDMLFHMGGHREAKKIRTIGASEAIARLRTLEVLAPDKGLDALIDVRNGVAHTGSGDEAKAFLPTLAETVETMLNDLGGPLDAFWGRWTATARMAVDNRRSEVSRDVQVRIGQARHRYDDRFSNLPDHVQERLKIEQLRLKSFSVGQTRDGLQIGSSERCPACGSAGHVLSVNQGTPENPDFAVVALRCSMCHLQLATRDELVAAGIDVESTDEQVARKATEFFGGLMPSEATLQAMVEQYLNDDFDDLD
ncbi:hypothetical protein JK361_18405 [Streptomyces sp. 5-8]|uniref:DUF4145 domain-containing protein n=1 Tax=Streptomyces musisoli TaxID=2802280 RepID=A0ABS1P2E3_9ACTN|nr:hypothetical protein [Streptomyces musisoli]MBL1106548.1 hypothetical protein [Streptomyces musisoli]